MTKRRKKPQEPAEEVANKRSRLTPNDALAVEAVHADVKVFGMHGGELTSPDPTKTTFRGANSEEPVPQARITAMDPAGPGFKGTNNR